MIIIKDIKKTNFNFISNKNQKENLFLIFSLPLMILDTIRI